MLDSQQRAALSRAFLAQKSRTTDRLVELAKVRWENLGSYNDGDAERFIELVSPHVLAGRSNIAALTAVYLARVAEVDPSTPVDTDTVRGKTVDEIYVRPMTTLRTELSRGASFETAFSAATARVASLVSTDMQLSMQQQVAASTEAHSAFEGGFRRTLTGRENCAKCYIASTQRYHRGNLLPIHPGCDCGIEALKPGENIGQVIEPERLQQSHDWVKGFDSRFENRAAVNYDDILVTSTHGEYGPTLRWRDQHFTGPADI